MAKKHGNWLFLCNFVGMKQTLPDYIKQHENFQLALLKLEDGFIKFFVEHSEDEDVNGTWYQRYQDDVFANYRKANSIDPDVMLLSLGEQRKKALGRSHMREEFRQRKELEKILSQMPKEAAEAVQEVQHLADGYLAFAFHQHIERCNPDHATDVGFYRSVIEQYSFPDGLFYRCMNIVLKEHHGYGLTEDDQYDAYRILEYRHFYLRSDDTYARLRRAVKEILSQREVGPQREIDYLLKGVRNFAQHVHTDLYVESVRSLAKGMKDSKARKEALQRADQRESDGLWLRQQAEESRLEPDTMLFCFAWFVDVLKHLSHIWAARLLCYHKIDMHRIEVENDCVMNPNYRPGPDGFDPYYYVDHHYKGETPVECCISDAEQAKELLKQLPKEETEDSKNKKTGNLASILKDSIMKLVDNINNNPEQITSIGKIIAKAKFDWSFMEAILCGLKEEWLMDMAIQIIEDKWKECTNKKEDCCYQTIGHIPDYGFDGIGMYKKDQPLKMLKYIDIKKALEGAKEDELKRRKVDEKFNKESASTDNPDKETPKAETTKGSKVSKKKGVKQLIKETNKLAPKKYYTIKYFRPDDNKKLVETKKTRVTLLYNKWQTSNIKKDDGCWGWLDARVSSNDFMKFFEGKDYNCNLLFSKCNNTILTIFLRCLLNHEISKGNKKERLIEHQTHHSAKSIIYEQFGAVANYEVKRLDNETIRRIKESIYILDFTLPLPPLKGGGDNDYDTSDDALQQYSVNIDLGIDPNADVEQAVKSGVLSEGKHT